MVIIYCQRESVGWSPITYMVELAAELLEARLLVFPKADRASIVQRAVSLIPRRGSEPCVVISPTPGDLDVFSLACRLSAPFGLRIAWIIDSFWTEHIPWVVRHACPFDHVFVTREEDVDPWATATRRPVTSLPWGSDVLRLGSSTGERPVDLLRVGRQPSEWQDDAATHAACGRANLTFAGGPPAHPTPSTNQKQLMESYARAKFLLAFSNVSHSTRYTHPTREYITGRWTDALACGASVAGVGPKIDSVQALLWPGALLELGTTGRDEGLARIAEAVEQWEPARAQANFRHALERLDWRWRLQTLARVVGEVPTRLAEEIAALETKLRALAAN